jgi:hypothetical protein
MKNRRRLHAMVGLAILFSAPGCATVMSGRHAEVGFYSNVPNATVVIRDKHGKDVAAVQAQSKVALKRNERYIFPARYTATFMAPGYQPTEVDVRSKVNPWVLGNVVIGGLLGLAVDNATGAAWTPKQPAYYGELRPLSPAAGPAMGPMYSAAGPGGAPAWSATLPTAEMAAQSGPLYTASAANFSQPAEAATPGSSTASVGPASGTALY